MANILARLRAGSGVLWVAAVVLILLAAGFYVQQGRNAQQATEQVTAVLAEPKLSDAVVTAPAASSGKPAELDATPAEKAEPDVPAQAPEIMTAAPAFDEVRREADGMTVIAGRGAPGATVSVMQNGVEIATSTVDRSGKFATLALIPPDGQGHSLTLSQLIGETAQPSEGEILLAPLAAPTDIVAADGEPLPSTQTVPETAGLATVAQDVPSGAAQQVSTDDLARTSDEAPLVQDQVNTVQAAEPSNDSSGAVAQVVAAAEPVVTTPQRPSAPAVIRSTAEGVELLNPDLPEVMDNVALDTISYSDDGEVQLAGRAQSDATSVRVYLDNSAVVDLPVDATGRWRGDVPDVDEGIYTLRVDEVSADGRVSSRVETPFKRESQEVLAAASATLNGPVKAITVQKGATLWAIARERYGEGELYVRVFEANKEAIRDPDLIYPGQIFELPQE